MSIRVSIQLLMTLQHFCEMAANYHSDTPHTLESTLYFLTRTVNIDIYVVHYFVKVTRMIVCVFLWMINKQKKRNGEGSLVLA